MMRTGECCWVQFRQLFQLLERVVSPLGCKHSVANVYARDFRRISGSDPFRKEAQVTYASNNISLLMSKFGMVAIRARFL